MKKWKQIYVLCLECGDKITNGMQCQCGGVLVSPIGDINSVEGSRYHVQKTYNEEDKREQDSN